MVKIWHKDFDPLTESFNKIPIWVRLPNLPMHLWLDSILESVGDAIGDFQIVDIATSNVLHSTFACTFVEMDVSKGLPEKICLASPRGSWTQTLDYEGLPFRCKKCHMTGHVAARCSSEKARSKRLPSQWAGASDKHYTITKSSSIREQVFDSSQEGLASEGLEATMSEVLAQPVAKVVV